ncbi:hypothetical protein DDE18_00570 [Nocardioides gansuensis]|uniref:GH16 domain-containing protein n=1 Tax=Nocardioides gansuensis TaxID=2138300 RepID=A0A2T8FEM6_9ACTN|nr:hypothetical protein DDE18_00570 [Nocardioides gansuensis]
MAGLAAAAFLPSTVLATAGPGTAGVAPAGRPAAAERVAQSARLRVLPQIVQQGTTRAPAAHARAAFVTTLKPNVKGRPVALQVAEGELWRTVDKGRTNGRGSAEFAAPAARDGTPLTYRVTAQRYQGLGKVRSQPKASPWLTDTWVDEFSGTSLGDAWGHRGTIYAPKSRRACSKGDPRATTVADGVARLSVLPDPDRTDRCTAYIRGRPTGRYAYRINGHIGTMGKFSFSYGFAAARVKMHSARGQHGGFWMLPQTSVPGETRPALTGAEVDVVEYFGNRHPEGGLASFTYSQDSTGGQVKTGGWIKRSRGFLKNRSDGWSKSFHVFSVEWTPQRYIFRIDGKETWRTKVGVSGQPEYLILSLLSSDYELSHSGDWALPQTMKVDWVRVWEA